MTFTVERSYNWWAVYAQKKMKPCPFCGGKGEFGCDHVLGSLVYIVRCKKCEISKRFGETGWWKEENKGNTEYTNQQMYRGLSGKALGFWSKRDTTS